MFIDSEKDGLGKAPRSVSEIRNQSYMGNTIPMVMVTTADLSKGLKGYGYQALSDTRKVARELKKELKEMDVIGSAPSEEADETSSESSLLAEEQAWTNAEGKAITAAIVTADENTVTFLMPNGKSVAYPLAKLSASSQESVRALLDE